MSFHSQSTQPLDEACFGLTLFGLAAAIITSSAAAVYEQASAHLPQVVAYIAATRAWI